MTMWHYGSETCRLNTVHHNRAVAHGVCLMRSAVGKFLLKGEKWG